MNDLTIFENNEFGEVRTIIDEQGEPWFVAKDVCDCLEIVNSWDAVSRLNDNQKDDLGITDAMGRVQQTNIINEFGVYKLIMRSNKPEAERFQDWIAEEVLPSIRKTGNYSLAPKNFLEALEVCVKLEKERLQLDQEKKVMLPKAEFFDTIIKTDDLMLTRDAAKLLGTGQNKLFKLLKKKEILMRSNMPYQSFIDRGYFRVKETIKNGFMVRTTYITQKGLAYIKKRFF